MKVKNPVAKNAGAYNKASTHRDRKNDYSRKGKSRVAKSSAGFV